MKQKIFQRLALVVSIGMACAAITTEAQANHSWGGYHWARTTSQFTLKLGNNLTTTNWNSRLSQASSNWNSGNSRLLTAIVGGSTNSSCAMVRGTTQVCNGAYGNTGWLGLASINLSGSHITQGTAKMNDTFFNTTQYNNVNERQHVMCQEVAHTFGLGHTSEDGSSQNTCMDYFSNTGANAGSTLSTKPNAHDFAQLNSIYAHLDSTTTAFSFGETLPEASKAKVDIDDDPVSWGSLVRQSANGRSSEYERHNLDSSVTLTHVYWTLEAAARCKSCDHRGGR